VVFDAAPVLVISEGNMLITDEKCRTSNEKDQKLPN
jgi:hypothetical protein